MPKMNGYDATQALRKQESISGAHRIPIVAMTASVVEGEERRCLAAGMDDYLAKPVNVDELGSKLRKWLGGFNDFENDVGDGTKTEQSASVGE